MTIDIEPTELVKKHWKKALIALTVVTVPESLLVAGAVYYGRRKYKEWKDKPT